MLEAIKILKKAYGDEVAIIGKTMGPWSLGYHCFGVEPFLLMSLDDPDKTKACLDKMKEITVAFGVAQIEAGADALTLPDHATGDLVSGEYYERFLRELHIEFVDRIPIPLILHICGRTVDRMEYIAQTGMAAFHYDSKNKPAESMEVVKNRISLVGNINNPETLFSKGPAVVRQEVYANLDSGVQLVGPECAIPLQTAIDNLKGDSQGGAGLARGARLQELRIWQTRRVDIAMAELADVGKRIYPERDRRVHRAPG